MHCLLSSMGGPLFASTSTIQSGSGSSLIPCHSRRSSGIALLARTGHITVNEIRTYKTCSKYLCRHHPRTRSVGLIDSRVLLGASAKGRSSSMLFKPCAQGLLALRTGWRPVSWWLACLLHFPRRLERCHFGTLRGDCRRFDLYRFLEVPQDCGALAASASPAGGRHRKKPWACSVYTCTARWARLDVRLCSYRPAQNVEKLERL